MGLTAERLRRALHRLPEGAAFSGRTAAWLHGLDLAPDTAIEVTVPTASKVTRRAGFRVRRSVQFERSVARGLPVTSRVQTVVDLARSLLFVEAVAVLDAALRRRLVTRAVLVEWADTNPRRRGVAQLRQALELAEPAAESPMETRLRLLLELAGLPKPWVQPILRDELGTFIARPDLYYPLHRLVIEYDGSTHRDRLVSDNRRQNRLYVAGYRVLRFTAGDVIGNPSGVVDLVQRALARPP